MIMTGTVIPHQNFCSVWAAANALGVSDRKVIDLLVLGELKGKFNYGHDHWHGRTLVRVSSICAFIARGETK